MHGGEELVYGMQIAMMVGLHNSASTFCENAASIFFLYHASGPVGSQFSRLTGLNFLHQVIPTFTPSTIAVIRQHMNASNQEMVNMLTQ